MASSAVLCGNSAIATCIRCSFHLGFLDAGTIATSAVRTLLASAVGGAGGWGTARLLGPMQRGGALLRLVPGLAALGVFTLLFVLAAWGVRSPELESLVRGVRRRLARS